MTPSTQGGAALLERDEPLAVLAGAFAAARAGGQLVAVCGEAGIGKSSLLHAFASREAAARVVWGYCESLDTPRPLGPLHDMGPALGGRTAAALAGHLPRHEVFASLIQDLARPGPPVIALFEDVHWADEATLDLLHYVGRRIGSTRALVVVSWRDDEVDADHSIHRVLGNWPSAAVHRIHLRPLSVTAIERLAGGRRDARAVHALTGGNPFFVTEVTAGPPDVVPASVREAVLARRARLDTSARAVLDLVSVVPLRTELGLISAALDPATVDLDGCITAGLLRGEPGSVAFRHELARLAVVDALPALRVHDYHQRVLKALIDGPDREQRLARIVHHADACGDVGAVLEYAPAAARQAADLGAHRQAVDHYRRALQHAGRLPAESRAELTEALAYEHYLTNDVDAAREARRLALALWEHLGVVVAVGRNIRWLSRLAWFAGDGEEADHRADEAIAVLSTLPEGEELAMAFSNRSQLAMLRGDRETCLTFGERGADLARRLGLIDILSHALNNVGTMRVAAGERDGRGQLEESLRLALHGNLHEHAARAYTNLASTAIERREYGEAVRWLEPGLVYCEERDLASWHLYMLAWRARLRAETGLWERACDDAGVVVAAGPAPAVTRIPALAVLGLIHARRGEVDARALLDEALSLARRTAEQQRLLPVLVARAELAWFTGQPDDIEAAVEEGLETLGPDAGAFDRGLRYWRWKADPRRVSGVNAASCGPYARLIGGDWRGAADEWKRLGCPFEQGLALIEGDLPAVRTALDIFQTLGATPAADWARQRLRQMGVARVPRGRRPGTRAHPAGLTAREAEILGMLALGLRNVHIADRLFVSAKTVEHHVSSILAKLQVSTRAAAVARARAEGWLPERRRDRAAAQNGGTSPIAHRDPRS